MVSASLCPPTALAVALLAAITSVDAHSNMIDPMPTWPDDFYARNSPSATIVPETALPVPDGMSYYTDPLSNTKSFETAFNASNYTSLREFAYANEVLEDRASHECGYSLVNGTARALPAQVEWYEFTVGHDGPCEVWCDDTRAFFDHNCAVDFPGTTGIMAYDESLCVGAKVLTSIWMALHSPPWQIFTNCAPLNGETSGSGSVTSDSSTSTTTTAPTTTTTAPTTTTTTTTTSTTSTTSEAASADDEYYSEDASADDEYYSEDASTAADYDDASAASTIVDTDTTTVISSTAASDAGSASEEEETEAPTATTAAPATTTAAPAATSACRRRMRN